MPELASWPLTKGRAPGPESVGLAQLKAEIKDGLAGIPSARTLGEAAQQAAPGNDARFGTGVVGEIPNGGLIWNGSAWVNELIGPESLILPWLSPAATQVGPVPRHLLSANNLMVLGTVYYVSFIAEKTRVITKMGSYVGTKGEGQTLGRMGLYSVGETFGVKPIAHTANVAAFWTATGATPQPLTSNNLDGTAGVFPTEFQLVRGTLYVVGMLAVGGAAGPTMRGPSVSTVAGQVATQGPPLVGAVTAQADIGGGNTGTLEVTRAAMVGSSICPGFFLE
jgi:hypothetical protein